MFPPERTEAGSRLGVEASGRTRARRARGAPPVTGAAGGPCGPCKLSVLSGACELEGILEGNNLTSFRFVFYTHIFQQKILC